MVSKNVEQWLAQNPPRVELTELEKNCQFNQNDASKYVVYFDNVDGNWVYRIREYLPGERDGLPNYVKNELDDYYVLLCHDRSKFGFNILGYSGRDLDYIRSKFNLFMQVF